MSVITARNAPCPCGSGKRFKNCHGAAGETGDEPPAGESLLRQARVAAAHGRIPEAEAHLARLLKIEPENVAAWNLLGDCMKPRDARAASEAWWRALELDPENAAASFQLGNFNLQSGEYGAALIHYDRALRGVPDHAVALNNLGLCCRALGFADRAEQSYRAALAVDPGQPDVLANLANLLFQSERYAEVVSTTDRLPGGARGPVRLLRALSLERLGDAEGSEEALREAVRLEPDDATLLAFLGTLYLRTRRYEEAEPVLARMVVLAPRSVCAISMLASARMHRCAWVDLSDLFSRLEALLAANGGEEPVPIDVLSTHAMLLSPHAQLEIARRRAKLLAPMVGERPSVTVAPGERLRVGFASSNFRAHPTMHLCAEFWEKIDRSALETFAYSLRATDDDDPFRERARTTFEHFVDVAREPTERIAQRIREDRIGVLVDVDGYTAYGREGLFALRPAPIQIHGPGFPGTMGAEWYDYILTDRFALPEHLQGFCVEQPLYMPHAACPSDTTRLSDPPPSRAACGLPERAFVFCCFNDAWTILPDVFASWMRLLAAVPASVLWLGATGGEAEAYLRREAATAGIDPQRLVFAPPATIGTRVARNAAADLFLDTYPRGGQAAANDALLAGLPLVTCAGETLASRVAGSQLAAIGLSDLITTNLGDYEALALRLATEPALLGRCRERLAINRQTAPLFDMARYARDFEAALQRIWADYRSGTPS